VLRGHAGPALLDSYHDERQPVGRQVVDRAMKSVADMAPISAALGFRAGQSAQDGWTSLDELAADSVEGQRRRAALAAAVDLQNYQFNCHGVELGQRYMSRAVVDDASPWPIPDRDPELYYQPTTHPGAHLPHAWLQRGTEPISTLDLTGSGCFSLLTGIGGEPWRTAAAKIAAETGVALIAHTIGLRSEHEDIYGDWARLREVDDRGCVLVRPDGHIAWRACGGADDPVATLRAAMTRVLARDELTEPTPTEPIPTDPGEPT
jgi:2,4-dichlorophenol 6-monooxygenase